MKINILLDKYLGEDDNPFIKNSKVDVNPYPKGTKEYIKWNMMRAGLL